MTVPESAKSSPGLLTILAACCSNATGFGSAMLVPAAVVPVAVAVSLSWAKDDATRRRLWANKGLSTNRIATRMHLG